MMILCKSIHYLRIFPLQRSPLLVFLPLQEAYHLASGEQTLNLKDRAVEWENLVNRMKRNCDEYTFFAWE